MKKKCINWRKSNSFHKIIYKLQLWIPKLIVRNQNCTTVYNDRERKNYSISHLRARFGLLKLINKSVDLVDACVDVL